MTEPLRIAIAEDEPELLDDLDEMLRRMGHVVVARAGDGRQLVELCESADVDLIVTDVKMPHMDGLAAAVRICQRRPTPVVVVSAFDDESLLERSLADHVLAYLVKPVNERTLATSIVVAIRRFREFEALHKQCEDLQQALVDRKIVERAKGVLMKRTGLHEEEAFRRLQQTASQKNKRLVEVAQSILTAEEAFRTE